MAGKTLDLKDILKPDRLATDIANFFHEWDAYRAPTKELWKEGYRYLFATDTRTTSNASLPWKNSTTTPKLTQIRDNLYANYMASMFPKRKWLRWEGATREDETLNKERAILSYAEYMIAHPSFRETISKLVLDYLDNGNCFATVDWLDERVDQTVSVQSGYVGPIARRISPYDIVMNPTAPDFTQSPKIIRSLVSLGEVKEILESLSTEDGVRTTNEELFQYLNDVRYQAGTFAGDVYAQDTFYQIDGFGSFRNYLDSGYAEILTFYGDIYDKETQTFYKNHIIQVVDRHKLIRFEPNPTNFGTAPIFHSGWRVRQDNLWAMGPFENLIGLQYRLDHIENLKADFFDLVYAPPLKIKGYVEDFDWKPYEKIYLGDEGDVELLTTPLNPLQANFELDRLQMEMEELAGAPKEAMGFRTPGEKTAYEVQRLENAASRVFHSKIRQFEEQILEPLLNAMIELARRMMSETTVRVLDDEFAIATFSNISPEDIAGSGRLRPIAARHFVETSERIQNFTNFYTSAVGQDEQVRVHFSTIEIAKMFEDLTELSDFNLVEPYIRLTEQAEAERIALQNQEDTEMGLMTPAGIAPDDFDLE